MLYQPKNVILNDKIHATDNVTSVICQTPNYLRQVLEGPGMVSAGDCKLVSRIAKKVK